MYVYFEMDEPTLLRYRRAVNEGKLQVPKDRANVPVFMGLQGEARLPASGEQSTLSTTRSIPRRAASRCVASLQTPS